MGLGDIGEGLFDIYGTLIGEALAAGDYAEAERLRRESAGMFDDVRAPTDADLERLGPSAMEGVQADPMLRAKRLRALQSLSAVGEEGGMDVVSRAALEEAKQDAAQYEQGQRGALMQSAARRGLGNSNLAMGSALLGQQAGADRVGRAGVQAAGDARLRQLRALAATDDVAGGINRDDLALATDKAGAADAIARFNAQEANRWKQQGFRNQMDLQGARYDVKRNSAEDADKRGKSKVAKVRGFGRAGGRMLGTLGDVYAGGM